MEGQMEDITLLSYYSWLYCYFCTAQLRCMMGEKLQQSYLVILLLYFFQSLAEAVKDLFSPRLPTRSLAQKKAAHR